MLSRWLGRSLPYLVILTLCYIASYVCLSAYGTYEPAIIGTNGVKWYWWIPAGYVEDNSLRRSLFYLYLPLHLADRAVWHRDDDAYSGKYPVHDPHRR
jgi:hypothetical protein